MFLDEKASGEPLGNAPTGPIIPNRLIAAAVIGVAAMTFSGSFAAAHAYVGNAAAAAMWSGAMKLFAAFCLAIASVVHIRTKY